jgi:hypothetical protein
MGGELLVSSRTISVRGHADIAAFEEAWIKVVKSNQPSVSAIEIDLSEVEYLDQECLLYLLGLICKRQEDGFATRLHLPRSEAVFTHLRAWRFLEALDSLMADGLYPILSDDSRSRLTQFHPSPPEYLRPADRVEGGRTALLPVSLFSISPIDLSLGAEVAADRVRGSWLNDHVVTVFDRHLRGFGERVATDVLYESIVNAATHSGADRAFMSAQLFAQPRPDRGSAVHQRELVITVWDNGVSFSDSLLRGLRRFGHIKSPAYGLVPEAFDLEFHDIAANTVVSRLVDDVEQLSLDDVAESSLAAFLLGVTALPSRGEHSYSSPGSQPSPTADLSGGLGLYIIRRAVVDLFKGSLYYASGSVRAEVRSSGTIGRYAAELTRMSASGPNVGGNLLVARMQLPA